LPPSFPWHSSPLRPVNCPPHKGLDGDQFNSMLKVSRDQRAKFGSQKEPDLRRELALKNQSLKQLERRSRFLSKVSEHSIAVVPLESPATPHCSISPRRFESDYSALHIAAENSEDLVINSPANLGWEEQAECDLLIAEPLAGSKFSPNKSRRTPPSLDEITARLKPVYVSSKKDCSRPRLPNFLKASSLSSGPADDLIKTLPVRSLALNDEMFDPTFAQVIHPQHSDPCNLTLGSRRAVIPHTVDVVVAGPTLHTSRADTARDMIETLRRRSSPPPDLGHHECTWTSIKVKRCSAPAELQYSGRVGF
jgi:hypothetical protein